ncbi:ROK family protein [Leifsonia poae]|uniref:ROK family protein n=1 Tax=Leifsonia poae TaxID=110933 RepID=UPI003D67D8EC
MSESDATIDPLPSQGLVDGSGLLLQLVRSGRAGTVSELAAAMGVSRSTAMQRLEFLVNHGLIESQPSVSGSRGRPAALARFNPSAGIVLAAQIGISGCRLAATDLGGAVLAESYLDVDLGTGPQALLSDLEDAFDRMLAELGRPETPVVGVGVGIPNDVELANYARGLGLSGTGWDRDYFRRNLWEHFDAPVFVDLDVNLIALAEWRKSWPDVEVFVCVKLGTLLNASIVVNGLPVRGVSGLAGELGHIKVNGSTASCSCGSVGCLDAVASGSALVRQLADAGLGVQHVSDVVRLAQQGEPIAVHAVRDAGRRIGEALASVVNLLNPAVIATWGYLTEAETPLFAGMREGLYQMALPGSSERLTLTRASLGDLAGVRGAATRVIDEVLDPAAIDRMIVAKSWSRAWPDALERAAG